MKAMIWWVLLADDPYFKFSSQNNLLVEIYPE